MPKRCTEHLRKHRFVSAEEHEAKVQRALAINFGDPWYTRIWRWLQRLRRTP